MEPVLETLDEIHQAVKVAEANFHSSKALYHTPVETMQYITALHECITHLIKLYSVENAMRRIAR